MGQAREEPEGRNRRGENRGIPGNRLAPLRGGQVWPRRRQDRGRPWNREPEAHRPAMTAKGSASIGQLIINSPYEVPREHWRYDRDTRTVSREEGRRPAGYIVATPGSRGFDDPGVFVEIPLVNRIRSRIDAWRTAGYPGITGITKRLLEHWNNPEEREGRRFFFCQLEAMETLIWFTEAPDACL